MTDQDVQPLEALRALVSSDGWALFLAAVEAAHGDAACVRQIDTALGTLSPGDHDAVQDTVQQIRASARSVQRIVRWPAEEVKRLTAQQAKPSFLGRRRT